jgi:hypothetical protein
MTLLRAVINAVRRPGQAASAHGGTKGITIMGISDRFWRRANSAPRAGQPGGVGPARVIRGNLVAAGIAVAVVGGLGAAALAAGGSAQAAGKPGMPARPVAPDVGATASTASADGYQFVTLGSHKDRTYNALDGINHHGRIAGSYGSGTNGHASKGYTITPPYAQGSISSENFPKSAQTEVFGLNDNNVQVGEYSTQNKTSGTDNSFGWYYNGKFHEVVYPAGKGNAKPTQDQLSAVNNHDIAVGSYLNGGGRYRSYTYNIKTGKFTLVTKPGAATGGNAPSLSAFGINNAGDVVGEYTASGGVIDGFLKLAGGAFHTIAVPGAAETVALGINDNDTVVGAYIDGTGTTEMIHGFIWRIGGDLTTMVDDPNADGFSYIDDINNEGDIVGAYIDSHAHFDGFLGYPPF